MVVRDAFHAGEHDLSFNDNRRQALGRGPCTLVFWIFGLAVTIKSELALPLSQPAIAKTALADDTADGGRVAWVIDAIADDDAHGQHSPPALATRFEVHGLCHARL